MIDYYTDMEPGPSLEIDPSNFIIVLGPTFMDAVLHKVVEDAKTLTSITSSPTLSNPNLPAVDTRGMIKEGISVLLDSQEFRSEEERAKFELFYKNSFEAEPRLKKLISTLQQRGRYKEWLNRSFRLHPVPRRGCSIINRLLELQDRGALLIYTGCDDALSKLANVHVLLPEDKASVMEWVSGERKGFLNVHGVYWKPDSLQLTCEVYSNPNHPTRSAMEHLGPIFKKRYVVALGVCDSQLENPMIEMFTRTFLAITNSHHCFHIPMDPRYSAEKVSDVKILNLPSMNGRSLPEFTLSPVTDYSKALCKC